MLIKNIFDKIASFFAVILLLLPWLIISVIIKIQSPGPVIYKAQRVGLDGKVFRLYKFRTMRVESGAIHTTTLRTDSRIFPFGKFLRKTKLDETPQFINIIKGDMSVIGPRPEDEVNAGAMFTGKYKDILNVKPGLSSPASLYDYTHGEKYESEEAYDKEFVPQKLELELYYVKHRNNLYDIKIIFRTVIIIIKTAFGAKQFKLPKEFSVIAAEEQNKNAMV